MNVPVRIDFGVDITLETDLSLSGVPGRIYTIQYPATRDDAARTGKLYRVYPAVEPFEADLPADVADFYKSDKYFPSDSLLNQWYGEAQSESYRKLGREIGVRLFKHPQVQSALDALRTMLYESANTINQTIGEMLVPFITIG